MSIRGMEIARTGMAGISDRIAILSHNLANLNSNGFRRTDATFADIFYDIVKLAGIPGLSDTPLGTSFGIGTQLAATPTDFRPGSIVPALPMDVAIVGEGFFQVRDVDGNVFYTRLGSFQPKTENAAGLVNLPLSRGVLTLDPPLDLPGTPGSLGVTEDGFVLQGSVVVGRLQLARFRNPQGLEHVGDQLFRVTPASGPPTLGNPGEPGFGVLRDNALETSNVDLASELVDLIVAAQGFNFNAQVFQTGNQEVLTTLELAR